ncbi:MAG: hypothetical protein JXQ29_16435, partial [Planctomycetes bacterium]|nr:hypothetical protein [Planctomycetota bacterium]
MAMTKWVTLTMLVVAVGVAVMGCGFRAVKGPISGRTWMQMNLDAEYFAEVREDYVRRHPELTPE